MASEHVVRCAKSFKPMRFPPLLWDATCVDSIFEIEGGADGADNTVMPAESEALPQAVHAFDSRAVRAKNLHDLEFLQLVGSQIKLLVLRVIQMNPADRCVHGRGTNNFSRVFQRVDHASMAATGEQNQAAGGVENKRLVLRKVVFNPRATLLNLNTGGIVLLRIGPRHRSRQPDTWQNFVRLVMF